MSSSFCSISLYKTEISDVNTLHVQCDIVSKNANWVTVIGSKDGETVTEANCKLISKKFSCAALFTEYSREEYVDFLLYKNGRLVGKFIPVSHGETVACSGKRDSWSCTLELNKEYSMALGEIFAEKDPDVVLSLMEWVLDCPLSLKENGEESNYNSRKFWTDYLTEKVKNGTNANQMKLVLSGEVQGDFGTHVTYPAVMDTHNKNRKSFFAIKDGHFEHIFDISIPGCPEASRLNCYGKKYFFQTFVEYGKVFREEGYLFSWDGKLLLKVPRSESRLFNGGFLDDNRLLTFYHCWNIDEKKKEWQVRPYCGEDSLSNPILFDNGRVAVIYNTVDLSMNSYLVTFNPDGTDQAAEKMPHKRHWGIPVVYKNDLLIGSSSYLYCYDSLLNGKWSVQLINSPDEPGMPYMDRETGVLYIEYSRRVVAFDVEKRKITSVRERRIGENLMVIDVVPGIGPLIQTSKASFQVWNRDLIPLSKHRTKGNINKVIHLDGNTYIMTVSSEEGDWVKADSGIKWETTKKGCLRVYEIK